MGRSGSFGFTLSVVVLAGVAALTGWGRPLLGVAIVVAMILTIPALVISSVLAMVLELPEAVSGPLVFVCTFGPPAAVFCVLVLRGVWRLWAGDEQTALRSWSGALWLGLPFALCLWAAPQGFAPPLAIAGWIAERTVPEGHPRSYQQTSAPLRQEKP